MYFYGSCQSFWGEVHAKEVVSPTLTITTFKKGACRFGSWIIGRGRCGGEDEVVGRLRALWLATFPDEDLTGGELNCSFFLDDRNSSQLRKEFSRVVGRELMELAVECPDAA